MEPSPHPINTLLCIVRAADVTHLVESFLDTREFDPQWCKTLVTPVHNPHTWEGLAGRLEVKGHSEFEVNCDLHETLYTHTHTHTI